MKGKLTVDGQELGEVDFDIIFNHMTDKLIKPRKLIEESKEITLTMEPSFLDVKLLESALVEESCPRCGNKESVYFACDEMGKLKGCNKCLGQKK